MNLKLYQKILGNFDGKKKLAVLWLNKDGEPLMHHEINQMIALAVDNNIAKRVEIYTNGTLLDKTLSEKLIKAGLDSLVVSLDALDSRSYQKLKGKDAYHQVVKNISNFLMIRDKMKAKKPILSVKMVDLGKQNDIKRFKKLWQKKADNVIIQKLHNWEGSVKNLKFKMQNSKLIEKRYPCNLPWLAPAVNWDGTMVPCCVNFKKNELVMGDLNKQSLKEIWQGSKYKKLRLAHLTKDFADFPTCEKCLFWRQLPGMEGWLKVIICQNQK